MTIGAHRCRDCGNLTFDVFCHLHDGSGSNGGYSASLSRIEKLGGSSSAVASPISTQSIGVATQVWAETKRVFPDLQDEISTAGIREQVRNYAEGAATTAALRFARNERLETDVNARDKKISSFTQEALVGLKPSSYVISQDDAEFVANSVPTDGLGGFSDFEDARAILSYGIRKEWELGRASGERNSSDNIPYDIPLESFIEVVYSEDLSAHVEVALRREEADFHENVFIATGSRAANPAQVKASTVPGKVDYEPIESSYFDEARQYQQAISDTNEQLRKQSEDEEQAREARIAERQEAVENVISMVGGALRGIGNAYKNTDAFMNKAFRTRPEDIQARNDRERKRKYDAYKDMLIRSAERRGKI